MSFADIPWGWIGVLSQIASYTVIWRMFKKAHHSAIDFGTKIGMEVGFDIGYLRAMSDDDATRREAIAAIKRKPIPAEMKALEPRF